MLARVCIKRFRYALYLGVIFTGLIFLIERLEGDAAGIVGAISFFLILPAALIAFVWALVRAVKDIVNVRVKGGALPENEGSRAAEWTKARVGELKEEREAFNGMDAGGKRRCVILRAAALVLMIGGIALFFVSLVVVPTLLLIAGAAIWLIASPKSFNEAVQGAKQLACPEEIDIKKLYRALRQVESPFGTPYLAQIKFVNGRCIVFGPDSDGNYIYLYKTADERRLYAAENSVPDFITEKLTKPLRGMYDLRPGEAEGECVEYDVPGTQILLEELETLLTEFIKNGNIVETAHFKPCSAPNEQD